MTRLRIVRPPIRTENSTVCNVWYNHFNQDMSSITCFHDLPDLVLIELLSYLSSIDVLWGFTHLDDRLTMLINERGFFHHINLSSARHHQFQTILRFLPLNNIQSLVIDTRASPLQLLRWPCLPRLTTLCIIDVQNFDELSLFILRYAATLTHLIININGRSIGEGFTLEEYYPIGGMTDLLEKIILVHLPALRSLDLGVNYNYGPPWPFTNAVVPLTYIRLYLPNINNLVKLMSTPPLSDTLRQLHVQTNNYIEPSSFPSISTLSIEMVNLHTFTLVQAFFFTPTIDWTHIELLTSSKVMPALRRANLALFMKIDDFNHIHKAPLFIDQRHVEVNFAFSLVDNPRYNEMTKFIPCGSRFHRREIVGATFAIDIRPARAGIATGDPYTREHHCCYHHMWYSLPWTFDEFFHEYIPERWMTKVHLFHLSSQTTTTIDKSSLRTLDAFGQTLASCLMALPHVVIDDCIETFHLSFYNRPIYVNLPNLRNLTLVNSINCLNYCSRFPTTIRSVRILLFHRLPNYMLPNWPVVLHSLSTLSQLTSLRIFMYDLLKTVDDYSCQLIAKAALSFNDFCFCFRYQFPSWQELDLLDMAFENHARFIKQLCHYILSLNTEKLFDYSIESEGYGLTIWS